MKVKHCIGMLVLSTVSSVTFSNAVTSMTLVNAITNQDIASINHGGVINLNSVGQPLNIRANTSGNVESVQLQLSGVEQHSQLENISPYALFGDVNSDYAQWFPSLGNYTLKATPYSSDHAGGNEGDSLQISFSINDQEKPEPGGDYEVTSFTLVDSQSNTDIIPLSNGSVISLNQAGHQLNIRANSSANTESVILKLSGTQHYQRTENVSPYALFGDESGNYYNWTPAVGNYTLEATAYELDNGSGTAGNSVSISFTVQHEDDPEQSAVTSLTLVDAVTNQDVMTLTNGSTIQLASIDELVNIRANTSGATESVQWQLSGTQSHIATDNEIPYALFGDANGDYNAWNPNLGSYTLTATPFSGDDQTGTQGASLSIHFQVKVKDDNDQDGDGSVTISGETKKWHNVILSLNGVYSSEDAEVNPFTDYRMNVTFTHTESQTVYQVPGYFAADGFAAHSSSTEGTTWRAHLSPDHTGEWQYHIDFVTGNNIAVSDETGIPVSGLDDITGSFFVTESDKSGIDLRGKGRLEYVGERYLKFSQSGEYFIKVGADAPENFLNYLGFDGTYNSGGTNFTRWWSDHEKHYNNGDPVWGANNHGKGIIGAINYLSDQGMNAVSFLTYNVGGDSKDVWPFIAPNQRLRYDISKLDQWGIVFDHARNKGMYLHFKTQETENDNGTHGLDGGAVGLERKLYYRELIARFGYQLALNWNLGEENSQTTEQQKQMANYFYQTDPYHHNIVIHTFPGDQNKVYGALIGNQSKLTGASVQTHWNNVHSDTKKWVINSENSGKPWVVANDEQGGANIGVPPDDGWKGYSESTPYRIDLRHHTLWGNLMAGGAGVEAYFGYSLPDSDLTAQSYESRHGWWQMCRIAKDFFNLYLPFHEMKTADHLTNNAASNFVFAKEGEMYAIYYRNAENAQLDLSNQSGQYTVHWYDPRLGGVLQTGSIVSVEGGNQVSIGLPPAESHLDWVALVKVKPETTHYTEIDGLVIMEAENTNSNLELWQQKSEINGHTGAGYMEFTGNNPESGPPKSPLEYHFSVNQSGLYYLHLFAAKEHLIINGEHRTDVANDAYVRLEGDFNAGPNAGNNHGDDAPLAMLKSDTKFFGGSNLQFSWTWGNHLDPGGEHNKRVAIYDLQSGENYKFVMSGRSQKFKVDRIVFRHSSVEVSSAHDLTKPETLD